MKNKKNYLLIILAIIFISILILAQFLTLPLQGIFYWLVLIYWIIMILLLKLSSKHSLILFLCLFLISTLIHLFHFSEIAEVIMRTGFVILLVGVPQALIEYIKNGKRK